jgi:hypothetical protein
LVHVVPYEAFRLGSVSALDSVSVTSDSPLICLVADPSCHSYAIAFFLIGLPSLHGPFIGPQKIITSVATWFYAVASAAGFIFFGLNFGEEAGAATEIWILRACIVQGLQQVWGESRTVSCRKYSKRVD